jgi:hypothetical protein
LYVSCGTVFQGPVLGSITLEHPADAGDAVVFLRCRGAGIHGDITTDAEQTRVSADGNFAFLGSLTFPTTESCHVNVHHPRYETVRVDLADALVQAFIEGGVLRETRSRGLSSTMSRFARQTRVDLLAEFLEAGVAVDTRNSRNTTALPNIGQRRAGKSRLGLYRLSGDGYERYDSASGYSLGELSRVVQDPSDSGRLWLVGKRDNGLVDFDKTSTESTLVGANNSKRNQSELLATAMADPRLKTLTTRRHETLDPDTPDLVWGVQASGIYLKRGVKVIYRWPAKLPTGPVEVTRDEDTTVWIASSEGLIEFPLSESLAELREAGY